MTFDQDLLQGTPSRTQGTVPYVGCDVSRHLMRYSCTSVPKYALGTRTIRDNSTPSKKFPFPFFIAFRAFWAIEIDV